jgi:hypothetical protein
MATYRKLTQELNELITRALDNGLTNKLLREIIDEVLPVTVETPIIAVKAEIVEKAVKAELAEKAVKAELAEKATKAEISETSETAVTAKSYTEPILTIKSIPCETIKKLFSTVASSKKAPAPTPASATAISLPVSSTDGKTDGSSSLPVSSTDGKTAAASINSVSNELWADIVDASLHVDDWKTRAMRPFEEFTDVPTKTNDLTIYFCSVPLHSMHRLVFTADSRSFSTTDLPEFLAKKDAASFAAFIEDMVSKPAGRENITLRKLVWRLIQFFFIHNLKDVPNSKQRSTIEHLKFCVANVVTVVSSPKKMTATSSDLRTYFKLSAEEVPSEQILREVAVIQAIQQFVLKEIHTLLSDHTVGENRILTANSLRVEFKEQKDLKTFCDTIEYDRKIHGWL